MRMAFASVLLAGSLVLGSAKAQDCSPSALEDRLMTEAEGSSVKVGAQMEPVMKKMEEVMSHAKAKNVPLNKQLSDSQADEFNKANAQFKYLTNFMVLEDTREKQIRFIFRLLEASEFMEKTRTKFVRDNGSMDTFDWAKVKMNPETRKAVEILISLESSYEDGKLGSAVKRKS